MKITALPYDENLKEINDVVENTANFIIRNYDKVMGFVGLGGRKADYDDYAFEFNGGANDELRKKHYDKSLRLLWKAEKHAAWSSFDDCTKEEKAMIELTESTLNDQEKIHVDRMRSEEFREFLDKEYTQEQKQAIVNILSLLGHGEAYAWLVSNECLSDAQSTGAKAALTMQVVEEAKHFVVLRELIYAFGMPVPRMPIYEYVLLERTFKAKGLEKFFGMNVGVEGLALSVFGLLGSWPGLEILKLFHLDESRHTALPTNYFKTKPMSWWQKNNPINTVNRFLLIVPALPSVMYLEKDFAILGVDAFDFIGSTVRKIIHLAYRVGFNFPLPQENMKQLINFILNGYCKITRENHVDKDFLATESSKGDDILAVEKEVFRLDETA